MLKNLFLSRLELKRDAFTQGWGAGRSRVILAPWSRSRRRLKKKQGAGAGAVWKKSQEPEAVKISHARR